MAKRQRGGARPGQRAPIQRSGRPAVRPAAPAPATPPARPSGSLSDDELARAAELEARIVDEERAAAASITRSRDRRRSGGAVLPARGRTIGTLTAVAEEEYGYVIRDLRRIAVVFAAIFGLLLVSWLLIAVAGVVKVT